MTPKALSRECTEQKYVSSMRLQTEDCGGELRKIMNISLDTALYQCELCKMVQLTKENE